MKLERFWEHAQDLLIHKSRDDDKDETIWDSLKGHGHEYGTALYTCGHRTGGQIVSSAFVRAGLQGLQILEQPDPNDGHERVDDSTGNRGLSAFTRQIVIKSHIGCDNFCGSGDSGSLVWRYDDKNKATAYGILHTLWPVNIHGKTIN